MVRVKVFNCVVWGKLQKPSYNSHNATQQLFCNIIYFKIIGNLPQKHGKHFTTVDWSEFNLSNHTDALRSLIERHDRKTCELPQRKGSLTITGPCSKDHKPKSPCSLMFILKPTSDILCSHSVQSFLWSGTQWAVQCLAVDEELLSELWLPAYWSAVTPPPPFSLPSL